MKTTSINFLRIFLFGVIAVAVSNIFRFDVFGLGASLKTVPTWLFLTLTAILEGSGVLLGAIVALFLLRKKRSTFISIGGTSIKWSFAIAAVPIILLSAFGVKNEFSLNAHLYGFIVGLISLVYCIMEEYGWRGYLQEELRPLKPLHRYLFIGFIWYFWHLSFLTNSDWMENLTFLGILVLASWGIGQVAEGTRSIVAAACFHLIVQIMSFNHLIKFGLSGMQKLTILGISLAIWLLILKRWSTEQIATQKNSKQ